MEAECYTNHFDAALKMALGSVRVLYISLHQDNAFEETKALFHRVFQHALIKNSNLLFLSTSNLFQYNMHNAVFKLCEIHICFFDPLYICNGISTILTNPQFKELINLSSRTVKQELSIIIYTSFNVVNDSANYVIKKFFSLK